MIMSYWGERFERMKSLEMQKADVCKADLKKVYEDALQKCLKDVESWYQRYAEENGISYVDAQKILNARELKAFKMDLREYKQLAQQENLSEEYRKILDQASIRARLTKAQELLIKTQMYCEKVAKAQEINITDTLKKVYEDSNYRAAYEIQRMKGKFETYDQVPESQIEKAINTRWASDGKDFSSRIWENKDKLVNTLRTEISRSLLLKEGTGPMAERISKQFNVSYHAAERLVETETAYVQESSMLDTYDRLGVDKYEIVATLDNRTSPICRHMDGMVFFKKGAKPGLTMPPFHCYCRSTTVPYIDGVTDEEEKGTRAARENGTGKTVFVPGNLKYQEWYDKYVKPHEEKVKKEESRERVEKLAKEVGFASVQDDVLSKLNSEITEPNLKQLKRLEDKFGIVGKAFRVDLTQESRDNGTIAEVSRLVIMPTKETLRLYKPFYGQILEDFLKVETNMIHHGWSMPCDESKSLVYSITHEYGHMIQNLLIQQAMEKEGWTMAKPDAFWDSKAKTSRGNLKWYYRIADEVRNECFLEIKELAEKIAEQDGRVFNLNEALSGYGKQNEAEFFAEVFANSQLGKPNDLGKAMNEWMKKKGLMKK